MPQKKTRVRATPLKDPPTPDSGSKRARSSEPIGNPIEEGLNLWTRYARETGETVTDFLHRFGEEQQKSYDTWASNVTEASRPKSRQPEVDAARARFEEWNRQAEKIGNRVRDAFETGLTPQRELLEMWAKPFLPDDATAVDRNRELMGIVQKLWSGLSLDLTRRLMDTMQPEKGFDEFVRAQDDVLKQFTENFQKMTQIYFTSPAFVTTFGKTLDNSLDLQKTMKDGDEVFRRMTGLPTRREIGELNQAVRDLSDQVSRLTARRP
ncbi:MAG: hypothetical protein WB789_06075 [Thermoplasmata archaeon]|jgi:hypothetical protein